ncbi:FtsQ-type POTRA domain-containing protein [Gulosibacter sp. 10]|uniref:FtsQ-type POTRA domain-containing protein n=1 Tax=Gulosibacter sp. 10 TaxID=1255570 RepID=UPI00097E93D7|nr:FtsQ-type POTRA domain-containing protein [Gulosibacter sp. 10]SJM65511.1 Cell division protein FtsQ [Gulosibacter sp. 10]
MAEEQSERRGGPFAYWRAAFAKRHHEHREVRRFTRGRRRRLTGWLIAGGTALFLAAFVAIAILSPIMSVRDIRIEGAERLDPEELSAALADLEGAPLAQLQAQDVGERLEQFDLVQSYSVQRLPPSELVVRIVERVPVGVVVSDDRIDVVDAAGVTLWSDAEAGASLPVIRVEGDTASTAFAGAAHVSLSLPAELRAEVEAITASSPEDVRLELRDGTEVLWGSVDDSAHKARVFDSLRIATADQGVTLYDVSSPERPVTR